MKIIHAPPVFQPVTIILETEDEVDMLRVAATIYRDCKAQGEIESSFFKAIAHSLRVKESS